MEQVYPVTENSFDIAVSIIIPAYCSASFLPRAVQSACDQTLSEIEILIVDDASTDNTVEVADALASRDEIIKVVSLKKMKVLRARAISEYSKQRESG